MPATIDEADTERHRQLNKPPCPGQLQATCVQDDVATYWSDLAAQGVPGSDQDHLNEGLQVCAGQPGPSKLVATEAEF